jgi:cardiolipin synthase A/B
MTTPTISPLQLLDAKTYIKDLTTSVKEAKTRINLISLVFADGPHMHELIEALTQALKRDVTVTIAADVFTYSGFGGYFSPFQRLTSKSRAVSATVAHLRTAGASFTWLGSNVKLNPFGGVTHLKWAVVDDTTYCFGGVNLYEEGIESVDYMFKSTHAALAEQICEQQSLITANKVSRRIYAGYTSESAYGTIFIDNGKPYESTIYDRVLELTKKAEHVLIVTQYCPSGGLAHLLRGKSDVYYNQPSQTPFPDKLLIKYGSIRTGLRSQYARPTYLHAKFIIFTMPDGKKIAITGSHNFSYSGVIFGTREVALETSDSTVIKQLERFYRDYVA